MPTGRQIQAEWNSLVPQAQALGIRVNVWSLPPETRAYGTRRLEWLRAQLAGRPATTQPTSATSIPTIALASEGEGLGEAATFTFGVEFEFIRPSNLTMDALAIKLCEAGIACAAEGYNHAVRSRWKIVTDGSLSDQVRGCELVSPVLMGEDGIAAMRKACDVLTATGCVVNRSCGLHVHIGARAEAPAFFRNLIAMYSRYESIIDSILAPSRRGSSNNYCGPVQITNAQAFARANDFNGVMNATSCAHTRYLKLNMQSFWRHGTVEFRHHQGTTDANKAEQWVRFCLRMALAARHTDGAGSDASLESLLGIIRATARERAYFTERRETFARAQSGVRAQARTVQGINDPFANVYAR